MKYNKDKEKIVHLERYKVTPKDEDFKVMMITRTHDPEFSDVPNVVISYPRINASFPSSKPTK